jgi:PAS domain S-box-containing protein
MPRAGSPSSPIIERLLGWSPGEAIGQHFSVLVDDDSMPIAGSRWAEAVADPTRELTSRLELIHRDGRRIPYEVRAVSTTRDDGSFAGIHGAARDISDRERLERELRDSEARYRFLVESSPDVI